MDVTKHQTDVRVNFDITNDQFPKCELYTSPIQKKGQRKNKRNVRIRERPVKSFCIAYRTFITSSVI